MNKCLIFNCCLSVLARPLGAYRIAHVLREEGWDAEVIEYTDFWTLEELKELAKSRITDETLFIGFGQTFNKVINENVASFCIWLKKNYPNLILIYGSSTSPPYNIRRMFDVYIKGFGEHALLAYLKWQVSNGPRPVITIDTTGKKIINANLNYPAYPLESLMVKYQDRDFVRQDEWLSIEVARGCKFKCDFCNFPILGVKGDFSRSSQDFYEQMMDTYDRYGVTNYIVSDETFNDRTEKIIKFADVVEKMPFTPWFTGFIRVDLLISRPEDRVHLSRMNFLGHHYGIESFNHEAAKSIKKGMHPDKVKQGLIDIKNYFHNNGRRLYRGYMSLIVGLPGETKESLESSRQWLIDNWRGESFITYALEIPIGADDVPSLMSSNYHEYGYKAIPEARYMDYVKEFKSNVHMGKDKLIWQNEHMTIFEALEISKKFEETRFNPDNGFTVDPWTMSHLSLNGPVQDIIDLVSTEIFTPNEAAQKIIKEYKHKKLSL